MGLSLQSIAKGTNVNKVISKLQWAIAPGAFIEQLTEKDRASWPSGMTLDQTALEAIAVIAGRVFGAKITGAKFIYPKTFRPIQAITNKYVAFWLGVEIAGEVAKAIAPFVSKYISPIQKIARIAVIPGSIGAVFDDMVPRNAKSINNYGKNPATSRLGMQYTQMMREANK